MERFRSKEHPDIKHVLEVLLGIKNIQKPDPEKSPYTIKGNFPNTKGVRLNTPNKYLPLDSQKS